MKLALERFDRNAQRLMRGGEVVGMLLRLANDRWGIYDRDERPLTRRTFSTPRQALAVADPLLQTPEPKR